MSSKVDASIGENMPVKTDLGSVPACLSYRMMMGEYLIYYRGKIAAYICDGRFLVKPVPSAIKMLPDAEYDAISEGGRKKLLRVDDVDNKKFLTDLFNAMYDELPEPKQKKANKNSQI